MSGNLLNVVLVGAALLVGGLAFAFFIEGYQDRASGPPPQARQDEDRPVGPQAGGFRKAS